MKSGSTGYFKINLDVDLSVVNEIIFSLKSFAGLVQKTYPGEVEYDGAYLVPLNQADTVLLQGYVAIEAQINLVDNGVVKSAVLTRYIDSTLATKFLDENTPALIEEVNMDVEAINIVRVGGGDTPVNAYTKAETDALFAKKTDIPDVSGLATREYVDGKIAEIDVMTESDVKAIVTQYLIDNPQTVPDEKIAEAVEAYLAEHPISGVTPEQIAEAVNAYLSANPDQFKGEKGDKGNDGYTPIKGVDYFDGAKGDRGIQGEKGADGYTPIKGVDYFDGAKGDKGDTYTITPADYSAIADVVIANLPNAESEEF